MHAVVPLVELRVVRGIGDIREHDEHSLGHVGTSLLLQRTVPAAPPMASSVVSFAGKVAFVTGGARGFGRAFCEALGRRGAAVAVVDIDIDTASRTAAELVEEGIRAHPVPCDVADERDVDAAVELAVEALGGVDILINNAGKHLSKYSQPFGSLAREEIRGLFDVNIMGVINCSLRCRDAMLARGGGTILNISSVAGYKTTTPYGVSKLAVRGLTVAFATEFAPDHIRVNAIAPGLMATENAVADLPRELFDRYVDELQLVRRTGSIDDVVAAMLYLCSDDAAFVTGETLRVAGGHALML